MGQMKELVMDIEEQVAEQCFEDADGCKNFDEFKELVINAYKSEDYLFSYTEYNLDYVNEVASGIWFEELGNTR
jgi:hypothetical protein